MSLLDKASLIVTPNSYKESKLYSVVPNTTLGDMDVVRATTATRVNSAGLIEVVPRNLVTYSNTFSNADWVKSDITFTSGQSDPFGGTNGWRYLTLTAANGYSFQNGVTINGQEMTLSFWVKSNTGSNQTFTMTANSGTQSSPTLTANSTWQRVTWSFTSSNGGSNVLIAYNGTSILDLLIYGFQAESSSTATEYFPTTTRLNIPRIDYSNGSCPSILVEPQRTNQYTYSQQLNQWSTLGAPIITENDAISPDGTQNADRVQLTGAGDYLFRTGTGSAGSNTLSVYAKAKSGTSQKFRFFANAGVSISSDLIATNQWQRFEFTYTYSQVNAGIQGPSTGTSDVLFYGFQHEIGAYPTSYIPTIASTVTRNADVISKTGISSLIGQTEGTIFVDLVFPQNLEASYIGINDGTSANRIILGCESNTFFTFGYGTAVLNLNTNTRYKIALAYNSTNMLVFINGVLTNTVNGTVPSGLSKLSFDSGGGTQNLIASVNLVTLFPTRLTNSELAQLTTI